MSISAGATLGGTAFPSDVVRGSEFAAPVWPNASAVPVSSVATEDTSRVRMGNSPFLIPELEYRQRDTTSGVSEIIGIAVKAHEVRTSIVFGVNGKSVRERSLHE